MDGKSLAKTLRIQEQAKDNRNLRSLLEASSKDSKLFQTI